MKISFNKEELNLLVKEFTHSKLNINITKLANNVIHIKLANITILITPSIGGGKGQIIYFEVKLNNSVLQLGSFIAGLGGNSVIDYLAKNSDGLLEKKSRSKLSLNLLKITHRYNLDTTFKLNEISASKDNLQLDIKITNTSQNILAKNKV